MNRNFNRFLEAYCKELAGVQTLNIRKLAALTASDRPRLREALLVFCLAHGKEQHLMKVMPDQEAKVEYDQIITAVAKAPSLEVYLSSGDAPKRYAQVYDAFLAQGSDLRASDLRINELLRKKTLAALEERGATRYSLCKALGLNTGNVYTYLAGDPSKVSRNTARRIYDYALGR